MSKQYAVNKKAMHDYHILEKYEAGLVLLGTEVKSVREGKINIKEAYITEEKGEFFLIGAHIARYEQRGYAEHDPLRKKKLLLNKDEIKKLIGKSKEKGLTLVPLSVYPKGKYIKLAFALAKGKKLYDKRESLKAKAIERDFARKFK